jgi:hypothetical protein
VRRGLLGLTAFVSLLIVGCGEPTITRSPGPTGFIVVTLDMSAAGPPSFFEAIHRAQLRGVDGDILAAWQVTAPPERIEVEAGTHRLEVFTVFLGDTIECVDDPAVPGATQCHQSTLGPPEVCSTDVLIAPGRETTATFRVFPEGLCRLGAT